MKDYGHTRTGDLDLTTGDLMVVESTTQHQRDLLEGDTGHFRQKPEIGIGAVNYLLDGDREGLLRKVRKELETDGQRVKRLSFDFNTGNLEIDAKYEES